MRLTRRLDTLARRLPPELTRGEDAINRAVFARYRQETDAAYAAAPPIDYDAFTREFDRLLRDEPDFWEEYQAAFTVMWEQEEGALGPSITIPGHGWLRERVYQRLRAQVTGARNAAEPTP